MNGHLIKYRYYPKNQKSEVAIPRIVLEEGKLNWKHGDTLFLTVIDSEGQKGLFLFKKEE